MTTKKQLTGMGKIKLLVDLNRELKKEYKKNMKKQEIYILKKTGKDINKIYDNKEFDKIEKQLRNDKIFDEMEKEAGFYLEQERKNKKEIYKILKKSVKEWNNISYQDYLRNYNKIEKIFIQK